MITVEALDRAIDGFTTITFDGQTVPLKMGEKEKVIYREFTSQGWCVYSNKTRTACRAYEWHCEIIKAPVIKVRHKRLYARVSADMILTEEQMNDWGHDVITELYYQTSVVKRPRFGRYLFGGPIIYYGNRVIKEQAIILAGDIASVMSQKQYRISQY